MVALLQDLAQNRAPHDAFKDAAEHVVDGRLIAKCRPGIIIATLTELVMRLLDFDAPRRDFADLST